MIPAGRSTITSPIEPHRRNGTAPDEPVAPIAAEDDAALAAVAHALSTLPRPPLSPVFRAQLHGDLVRLEAQLAAEQSRWTHGIAGLGILRRFGGPADQTSASTLHGRRWPGAALSVPVAIALVLTTLTAAGLAFAAERSRPGDILWPVRATLNRMRPVDGARARPESSAPGAAAPGAAAPADTRGAAASDAPSATVVGRAGRRPTVTPGSVQQRTSHRAPSPAVASLLSSALDSIPGDAEGAPVPALHNRALPGDDAQTPGSIQPQPGGPGEAPKPEETSLPPDPPPAPTTDGPPPLIGPSASPEVPPPSATPAANPGVDPDTATLTGIVRVRDGAAMAPLAGIVVSLSRVAADFPSGCDPVTVPPADRTRMTDADGNWTADIPAGRWIIAVSGGCLGPTRLYPADFNGAVIADACAALALPVVAGGAAPSAVIVIPIDIAPGCGPLPTTTPSP